jgi:peptidoglycan/xylan/chitin deacetylase (PgdA/CDA1 family)
MLKEIIAGTGVAAVGTWAGFQCYWPTSQVWGETFVGLRQGSRTLALTYDDGPNDPWTLRLLEVLERHSVKATFFLIGRFVQQKPEIARAIVAAGHSVGIHTWDHPNLLFASAPQVRSQLERTQQMIVEVTGIRTNLMRPPFGARLPATLRVVRELGLVPVMWNITCYDWKPTTPERILAHVERQLRGGDIILLHDGGHLRLGADRRPSMEATDRLIAEYAGQGYRFATIPEMIAEARPR